MVSWLLSFYHSKEIRLKLFFVIIIFCFLVNFNIGNAQEVGTNDEVAMILSATKFNRGLCLVLNDTDATLTKKLANNSSFIIQGLHSDQKTADRSTLLLANEPYANRASFIWCRVKHLPYDDEMINLIVIKESMAVEVLMLAEIERILRPDGACLIEFKNKEILTQTLGEINKRKLIKAEAISNRPNWLKVVKLMNPKFGEWTELKGGPDQTFVSDDEIIGPGKEIRWVNTPIWAEMEGSYVGEILAGGRAFHEEMELIVPGEPKVKKWFLIARDAFNGVENWREELGENPGKTVCADETHVYRVENDKFISRSAIDGKFIKEYFPSNLSFQASAVNKWLISYIGVIFEKDSGKVTGKRSVICPPSSAIDTTYMLTKEGLEAIKLENGETIWSVPPEKIEKPSLVKISNKGNNVYILMVHSDRKQQTLISYNKLSGEKLWSDTRDCTYTGLPVLPSKDQVALGGSVTVMLDAKTGKEIFSSNPKKLMSRCWTPRATEKYIYTEQRYFESRESKELVLQNGVRSSCGKGSPLAYGLVYNMPHLCFCQTTVRGFVAISSGSHAPKGDSGPVLIKGSLENASNNAPATLTDWPIYRSDMVRSNSYKDKISQDLKQAWACKIGLGALTQATIFSNLVFTAEKNARKVFAVDANSGIVKWMYATEGVLRFSPTYLNGMCFFGDSSGWVYCLDATSGNLIWKFQGAPEQRYMCAFGQIESISPIYSGVIALGENIYFIAGRAGAFDNALTFYALHSIKGNVLWSKKLEGNYATDILTSDNKNLYYMDQKIDPLNGNFTKSSSDQKGILLYGHGWQGFCPILDLLDANYTPLHNHIGSLHDDRLSGEIISFDSEHTIVSSRYYKKWKMVDYQLADDMKIYLECKGVTEWVKKRFPEHVLGVLVTKEFIYCVGRPDKYNAETPSQLSVLSSIDGNDVLKLPLPDKPTLDGLSAANGSLYVTLENGTLVCFRKK